MKFILSIAALVVLAACETGAPSRINASQDIVSPACSSGTDARTLRVANPKIKSIKSSEGAAILGFELSNSGEVLNPSLCQSSGQPSVDETLIEDLSKIKFAAGQEGYYRWHTQKNRKK